MTYFADLSPYTYHVPNDQQRLNVGWLDKEHGFQRGKTSAGFRIGLTHLCHHKAVRQTRGFHLCPFCKASSGSAEIEVEGKDGTVFVSPTLIYHYVIQHSYRPPQEFIDAVVATLAEITNALENK